MLDIVALDRLRQVAGQQVVDAQDVRGALPHQLGALAHQVAQGPQLRWADVPLRQDPEPQQLRQVLAIAEIVAMLETVVLLDRRRVHQPHVKARGSQSVDQPVPVVGRLDRDSPDFTGAAAQRRHDRLEIIAKPLCQHHMIGRIRHDNHAVVGVQINRCV